jgi:hypothetical protein
VGDGSPGRRGQGRHRSRAVGRHAPSWARSGANLALQAPMEVVKRRRSTTPKGGLHRLRNPRGSMTPRSSGSPSTGTCLEARRHRRVEAYKPQG